MVSILGVDIPGMRLDRSIRQWLHIESQSDERTHGQHHQEALSTIKTLSNVTVLYERRQPVEELHKWTLHFCLSSGRLRKLVYVGHYNIILFRRFLSCRTLFCAALNRRFVFLSAAAIGCLALISWPRKRHTVIAKQATTTFTTLFIDMTTRSLSPHGCHVCSRLERIFQKSKGAPANSTLTNEVYSMVQFSPARRVYDLRRDDLDVLSEQALNDYVEEEPENDDIDKT